MVVGLLVWWLARPGEQATDLATGPAGEIVASEPDPLRTVASGPTLEGVAGKAADTAHVDAPEVLPPRRRMRSIRRRAT